MKTSSKDDVLSLAKEYLKRYQPGDYSVEIVPDGVREEDDWWYIVVRPSRDDIKRYPYYEMLGEVEEELRQKKQINVMFVPSLADD